MSEGRDYAKLEPRKIDELVALKVMGWHAKGSYWWEDETCYHKIAHQAADWSPTTLPEHCALVKEKLREWGCRTSEHVRPDQDVILLGCAEPDDPLRRESLIFESYCGTLSTDRHCCLAWCILALRVAETRAEQKGCD